MSSSVLLIIVLLYTSFRSFLCVFVSSWLIFIAPFTTFSRPQIEANNEKTLS